MASRVLNSQLGHDDLGQGQRKSPPRMPCAASDHDHLAHLVRRCASAVNPGNTTVLPSK